MAAIKLTTSSSPTNYHEEPLCIIKVHQSGLVSASPAWSVQEAEDCDDNSLFASNKGLDEAINKGTRLTTYAFATTAGSIYEYSVEWNVEASRSHDLEQRVFNQNDINREINEQRRDVVRKDFESTGRVYEAECNWTNQAHVEIVSASGFLEPNILLSFPFGSKLMIKYKAMVPSETKENEVVVSKGTTNRVQPCLILRTSIQFLIYFTVAFVGISFALLFSFGNTGSDFSMAILLSIIPLAFIVKHDVLDDRSVFHFNHQFPLLFNSRNDSATSERDANRGLVLQLSVYHAHNFGVISLAGYGTVTLPTKPGSYEVDVSTWKPISTSSTDNTRGRMHEYYLGSCLDDIGPSDPVPTSEFENELNGTGINLFSKGGLHVDGSGSVCVRIQVMENCVNQKSYFNQVSMAGEQESQLQCAKMRETVDEVLTRVRRNKRGRMARVGNSDVLKRDVLTERQRVAVVPLNKEVDYKGIVGSVSEQTRQVLERVKMRQTTTSTYTDL